MNQYAKVSTAEDGLGKILLQGMLAEFEAPGEDGWWFDGFRRTYIKGAPSGWIARMVRPNDDHDAELIEGRGATMFQALMEMSEKLRALP